MSNPTLRWLIGAGKSYCATVERLRRSEFVVKGLSDAAARDW